MLQTSSCTILFLLLVAVNIVCCQDLIRQCLCSETDACKQRGLAAVPNCIEQCKYVLNPLGNPDAVKSCAPVQQQNIESGRQCVMETIGQRCNVNPAQQHNIPPQNLASFLQQFQQQTSLIFGLLPLSGAPQVTPIVEQFINCVERCEQLQMVQCVRNLNCAYELPDPSHLLSAIQQCAGLQQNAVIQATCNCFLNQGQIQQLRTVCTQIGITGTVGDRVGLYGGGGFGNGGGVQQPMAGLFGSFNG